MVDVSTSAAVDVVHNPAESRFEVRLGDDLAELDYRQDQNTITFLHTGVPDAFEGRGVGGALAKAGLEYAKAEKLAVVPRCAFVKGYIERHPEYQPLVRQS
jgi:hypothetical protein